MHYYQQEQMSNYRLLIQYLRSIYHIQYHCHNPYKHGNTFLLRLS